MIWVSVCFSITLFFVALFDFRERLIPLIFFILLFILSVIGVCIQGFLQHYLFIIINFLMAGLNTVLIAIWFKMVKKKKSSFMEAFGLGDILMLLIGAFWFSPAWYLLFILASSIGGLLYGLAASLSGKAANGIPLAGIMAMLLISAAVLSHIGVDFFNDYSLLRFIHI